MSNSLKSLLVDWKVNEGRPQIQVFLVLYRLSSWRLRQKRSTKILTTCVPVAYKFAGLFLGIDFPARVRSGPGIQVHHGVGLVVHPNVQIGRNVVLRHGVTVGNVGRGRVEVPTIGDDVEFGAGSSVIGGVHVGDRCLIGLNSVVTKDIAPCSIVRAPSSQITEPEQTGH